MGPCCMSFPALVNFGVRGPLGCQKIVMRCRLSSVTRVFCGQTVSWIRMPLSVQVGLGPGHIVLDGDPDPHAPKGHSPPILGPCLLWPNGWVDQDATWYGGRPWPKWHCIRCGPSSTHPKGHSSPPQFFSAHWPAPVIPLRLRVGVC